MPSETDNSGDVVEVPFSACSAESRRVCTFSDFVGTDCRSYVLLADKPARPSWLTEPSHVEILCGIVREGRWLGEFSAF